MLRGHPHLQGLLLAAALFSVVGAATPLVIDSIRDVTPTMVPREEHEDERPGDPTPVTCEWCATSSADGTVARG